MTAWVDVALDFIKELPKVGSKLVILTVVDPFSKYCHFIPLAHPYTAETIAKVFFTEIVRLHGILTYVVSNRDLVFTSTFWRELMSDDPLWRQAPHEDRLPSLGEWSSRIFLFFCPFFERYSQIRP